MSGGKLIVIGLVGAMIIGLGLAWWMSSALGYEDYDDRSELLIGNQMFAVTEYRGAQIDGQPYLELGCFRIADAARAVASGRAAGSIEPRRLIDAEGCRTPSEIRSDVAAGRANAVIAERVSSDRGASLERIVAIYPDGEAYLWPRVSEDIVDRAGAGPGAVTIGGRPFAARVFTAVEAPGGLGAFVCLRLEDPAGALAAGEMIDAAPPSALPHLEGCKSPAEIADALAADAATAVRAAEGVIAIFPDGEAYQWRAASE